MARKTKLVDQFNTISSMGMLGKTVPNFISENITSKTIKYLL